MDMEDQADYVEGIEMERWKPYSFMNNSNPDMEGHKTH